MRVRRLSKLKDFSKLNRVPVPILPVFAPSFAGHQHLNLRRVARNFESAAHREFMNASRECSRDSPPARVSKV